MARSYIGNVVEQEYTVLLNVLRCEFLGEGADDDAPLGAAAVSTSKLLLHFFDPRTSVYGRELAAMLAAGPKSGLGRSAPVTDAIYWGWLSTRLALMATRQDSTHLDPASGPLSELLQGTFTRPGMATKAE